VLDAAAKHSDRAKLAVDIFTHRLQAGIAAMTAALGGVDVIIFTAGIGENAAEIRRDTCAKLGFLGIQLDHERNSSLKPDGEISTPTSKVRVLVIRAQEDWSIARECVRLSRQ